MAARINTEEVAISLLTGNPFSRPIGEKAAQRIGDVRALKAEEEAPAPIKDGYSLSGQKFAAFSPRINTGVAGAIPPRDSEDSED